LGAKFVTIVIFLWRKYGRDGGDGRDLSSKGQVGGMEMIFSAKFELPFIMGVSTLLLDNIICSVA
jgi:hypothetical protein